MKKAALLPVTIILMMLVSCVSQQSPEADATSAATPLGEGWSIKITGVRTDEIWESHFAEWKKDNYREMELEKKGEISLYGGIPFSLIAAMVDDAAGGWPNNFQEDLWAEGYDITFTAGDGYSATVNTADMAPDDIILVDTIDGAAVPPQIAGNISGKAWVKDLVEIELALAPVDLTQNDFQLELDINGQQAAFTIGEMEKMDIYAENKGSFTNSYGNRTDSYFGGIKLIPLLEKYMAVTKESSIKVIAMDGYEMNYGGEMLLDQADGDWILAFKENGEYMPEDPGYIRLVKIGPQNPNITGHTSARMIKKIVTEGEPFVDFELVLVQKDMTEVFDRQTMQSGVVTNRNRVSYYDRKADAEIPYMGIALWRLLERPTGYRAVMIEATDGFSITLDNSEVEGNDDVIIAMYTGADDRLLGNDEWPLRLVWDRNAAVVPDGIKSVRNVSKITLIY